MKKSITGRTKHTRINYIFFALHLTKGQEITKKKIKRKKKQSQGELYLSSEIFFFWFPRNSITHSVL